MRLHRDSPPPESEFTIGNTLGVPVWIWIAPRALVVSASKPLRPPDMGSMIKDDGAAMQALGFFPAFAKACAVLWGENWHGPLELVCGLRKRTARRLMRDQTIPPPRIVGWVAYLSTLEHARAIGRLLEALAHGAEDHDIENAEEAFDDLNGG